MHKISRRVMVCAIDSDRIPFAVHRDQAETMLKLKQANVEALNSIGSVVSIRLTGTPATELENARPGSFGIYREHLQSGHMVFQHHPAEIRHKERRAA